MRRINHAIFGPPSPACGCLSARDERDAQAAAKRIGRKTVPCGVPG
ncbi:MAG: hypothetical protein ACLRWP_06265 [Bilophila wadsworthia]